MNKTMRFLALGFCVLTLAVLCDKDIMARLTGTNPTGSSADVFCVGKSGAEACVTSTGSIIPTTTAVSSLGTASLQFTSGNFSGAVNALSVVPTDTSASRNHLPVVSSQTMLSVTTTLGDQFLVQDQQASINWVCVSTGGANALVYSSSTARACRQSP